MLWRTCHARAGCLGADVLDVQLVVRFGLACCTAMLFFLLL